MSTADSHPDRSTLVEQNIEVLNNSGDVWLEERVVLIPDELRIGGGRKLDFGVADSLRQLRHRGDGDGFQEQKLL